MSEVIVSPANPATDAEINELQVRLGFEVPGELLDLFRKANGFYVDSDPFIVNGREYYVSEFLGVSEEGGFLAIDKAYQWWAVESGIILPCHVPFATAGGGADIFVYSLCDGDVGSILLISSEQIGDPNRFVHLFSSIYGFLEAIGISSTLF